MFTKARNKRSFIHQNCGISSTKAKINVLAYCNRHRERFRFVCPDPTRFKKYSSDAIEFCNRYQSFCPNEALPSKPQPFQPKVSWAFYSIRINIITWSFSEPIISTFEVRCEKIRSPLFRTSIHMWSSWWFCQSLLPQSCNS